MTGDLRAARAAGPAPADAKCGECGARMPIGARFCSMCGAAYATTNAAEKTGPSLGVSDGFKFGLGFALAATVVGIVVWLIGMVLLGAVLSAMTAAPAATFSGTGPMITDSFRLAGDVDVTWSADPISAEGCRHTAMVYLVNRANTREVIADQQVGIPTTGAYTLRGLAEDRYVVEVDSGCQWSFRFEPRS